MKTKIKIFALFLLLFTCTTLTSQKANAQAAVNYQVFYDDLSPYGQWINYPSYGYVWSPNVDPGFVPYATNGYWAYTDMGWTWVSYYSWGWAPFHYGCWFTDATYGPLWIPGYEWSPAWVTWRSSIDYYGWASICSSGSIYDIPYDLWTFVDEDDFGRQDLDRYYVNKSYKSTIFNESKIINNTFIDKSRNVTYNAGPDVSEVEKRHGSKITPYSFKESEGHYQKLRNNEIEIYRPNIQENNREGNKSMPSRVENMENIKTWNQRNSEYIERNEQNNYRQQEQQQIEQINRQQEQRQIEQPSRYQQSEPQRNYQENNNEHQEGSGERHHH